MTLKLHMIPEYTERVAIRLSIKERKRIEQLIKKDKYQNMSQIIRASITDFLEKEFAKDH